MKEKVLHRSPRAGDEFGVLLSVLKEASNEVYVK